MKIQYYILMCTALILISAPSSLYAAGKSARQEPLEISAQESLEWHRNEKFFKASKDVVAKQGQTVLRAAVMTAEYKESAGKSMDIHTIKADGSVRIETGTNKAYGEHATYDLKKGYAVMTGRGLKMESPEQTVTATDRFEYWVQKGELSAVGNAKAVRAGDTLESERIQAYFTQDSKGSRALKSLEATGQVVITTETEVLTGERATYDAQTNLAQLIGNVKVRRGPNILEGDRAEVDLKTNISKMFGSKTNGGRVKGVFFPGSEKSPQTAVEKETTGKKL